MSMDARAGGWARVGEWSGAHGAAVLGRALALLVELPARRDRNRRRAWAPGVLGLREHEAGGRS